MIGLSLRDLQSKNEKLGGRGEGDQLGVVTHCYILIKHYLES